MNAEGITPQGRGLGITAEWVWTYFHDVDTMEPGKVTRHYADDGTFRFANESSVGGKGAIRELLEQFYGSIKGMSHRNTGLWLGDNTAVFESDVTFKRENGAVVTLPAVSVIRRRGDLITDFRFVMDATPLNGAVER